MVVVESVKAGHASSGFSACFYFLLCKFSPPSLAHAHRTRTRLRLPFITNSFQRPTTAANNITVMAGTQANLPPPNSDEWLAYSPEFVYKYHTARLSGRLLVYVSLGYGWLKMEEHHPQSGTRINVLHKLSNDIDRLCRDQGLNPKVFRESFDRGRSRNIAYKDGKRGDKLDKATVVHPTNILSAPSRSFLARSHTYTDLEALTIVLSWTLRERYVERASTVRPGDRTSRLVRQDG